MDRKKNGRSLVFILGALIFSGFFLRPAHANTAFDIFFGLNGGVGYYTNSVDDDDLPLSFGFNFGSIFAGGLGISGFMTAFDEINNSNVHALIYQKEKFTVFGIEPAYFFRKDGIWMRIGIRVGVLNRNLETKVGAGRVVLNNSFSRFFMGPVAGLDAAMTEMMLIGVSAGWSTTMGGGDEITRIDPRVELKFNF